LEVGFRAGLLDVGLTTGPIEHEGEDCPTGASPGWDKTRDDLEPESETKNIIFLREASNLKWIKQCTSKRKGP
jgi:hypothetical protein